MPGFYGRYANFLVLVQVSLLMSGSCICAYTGCLCSLWLTDVLNSVQMEVTMVLLPVISILVTRIQPLNHDTILAQKHWASCCIADTVLFKET